MRLEIQRPELVHAKNDLRFAGLGDDLAVGDRIQVLDPGLLHRVVRVFGDLPGFQPLKGDALLAEQHPQALVADVVDHPLSDQELRQLRQAPGGKRQVMLDRPRPGDLLDLPPLRQRELGCPPAPVPRVQRGEPVSVEVADHIADPVLAGERHPRDRRCVHALRGQQHHLRPPPGNHRPAAPAHDTDQTPALIIIDLTHPQTFGHRPSLKDQRPLNFRTQPRPSTPDRANVTCYGTRGHQRKSALGHPHSP